MEPPENGLHPVGVGVNVGVGVTSTEAEDVGVGVFVDVLVGVGVIGVHSLPSIRLTFPVCETILQAQKVTKLNGLTSCTAVIPLQSKYSTEPPSSVSLTAVYSIQLQGVEVGVGVTGTSVEVGVDVGVTGTSVDVGVDVGVGVAPSLEVTVGVTVEVDVGVGVVPSLEVTVGVTVDVGVGVGVTGVPQQSMSAKNPRCGVDIWYGLSVTQTFTSVYPETNKLSVPPEQYETFQVFPLPIPPSILYS
jgi:hypothetical protein